MQKIKNDTIKQGSIQYFFALGLCDSNQVDLVIKKLQNSSLTISEEIGKKVFQLKPDYVEHLMNEAKRHMDEKEEKSKKDKGEIKNEDGEEFLKNFDDGVTISLHIVEINSKMEIKSIEYDNSTQMLAIMCADLNAANSFEAFLNFKRTDLLLRPILILNKKSEYMVIKVILSIFENGVGILNFETFITDKSIQEISSEKWSLKYDYCKMSSNSDVYNFNYYRTAEPGDEIDLRDYICKAISNRINQDITKGGLYKALYLIEYDTKPNDYKRIGAEYDKNIYSLLAAPVYSHNIRTDEKINEIIKTSLYEINRYSFLYAYTLPQVVITKVGDDIPLIRTNEPNDDEENFANQNDDYIRNASHRSLVRTITPAIEAVLLKDFIKKQIAAKCFNTQNKSINELLNIKKEIHSLKAYTINCFRFKFDSLTKFAYFLDNQNTSELTDSNVNELISGFDNIVSTRDMIIRSRISLSISAFGLLLSLILSYVGISNIFNFIHTTLKIFSLKSLFVISTVCWILLICLAFIIFYKIKYKNGQSNNG